jgi:hypothetical protein
MLLALLAGTTGLVAVLGTVSAQEFPREGNPAIANGVAGPFAGRWWIGFPQGEGMINGEPVVDCAAGVELVAQGDALLLYRSSTGNEASFELMEFSGRTTWLPAYGESTIAVWIDEDEFFAYSVDLGTGKARWDNPVVYRRC